MGKRTVVADTNEKQFKYVSFTDQISRISADTISTRLKLPGEVYEHETFFYQAIAKWNDLDYGDDYKAFLDDIPYGELATYAQLLHYQNQIVDALRHHLLIPGSKACITLLELSVALIRDLNDDFYPHLWDYFDTIMTLLDRSRHEVDILETGFKILAIIFQMHWRSIVTSLRKTFVRFLNLFGSNAHYIRRFAAEAFSFLLRKSSSIPKLTQFLYEKTAEEDDKNIKDGVVQLLFNGIKGTHKQFHSKTNELLTGYVESALDLDEGNVRETALEVLIEVMKLCIQWAKVEYTKVVTEVLLRILSEQMSRKSAEANIKFLLNLFVPWVTERHGKNFGHPVELFNVLKSISSKQNLAQLDYVYLSLIAKTLITYSSKFTDPAGIRQVVSGAAKNFLSSVDVASVSAVFSFFTELIDLNIFDIWCISSVGDIVNFILEKKIDDDLLKPIIKFFAVYCIKRKPFLEEINEPRKLFFDVSPFAKLRDIITEKAALAHITQDELSVHSLVVYPWIWRLTEQPNGLKEMSTVVGQLLETEHHDPQISLITYLMTYAITLVQPSETKSITVDQIIHFLENQNVTDEVTLRTAFLLLTNNSEIDSIDHFEYFEKFAIALEPCYICPSSVIRRLALKILNKFDGYLKHGSTNDEGIFKEADSVFTVLLEIEEAPANIQTYRRRAALIRRVNYKLFDRMMPEGASTFLKQVPLKLVISQLFEKFTLLWPSVHEAVDVFASSMPINNFWDVYQGVINLATEKINNGSDPDKIESPSIFDFLRTIHGDYDSFRIQIFKMTKQFIGVAERKNKEIVDTLINLYRDEYLPVSPGFKKLVDLRKHEDVIEIEHVDESQKKDEEVVQIKEDEESSDDEAVENDKLKNASVERMEEGSEDEIEQDENVLETAAATNQPRNAKRKKAIEALRTLLETFARFSNPKNVKREPELKDIYNQLLKCDQNTLRSAAFHCIVAYRYSFLAPYVDYFTKLLDSKQFREGLVLFSISDENSVIQNEHREELMPYLLKILYGSLSSYVMVRAVARRNAILTYLGGCQPHELQLFFEIMFGTLLDYVKIAEFPTDLGQLCEHVLSSYDPSNTLSPKKLKSLLNFATDICKRISSSLNEKLAKFLYRIVLSIGLLLRLALEKENEIEKYNFTILKSIRIQFFDTLSVIFEFFKNQIFTSVEIECLWKYVIEPVILQHQKSTFEHFIPASVSRFITSLTRLPMFYPLLIKPFSKAFKAETPLSLNLSFLNSKECTAVYRNQIVTGIFSLLSLRDEPSGVPELPESNFKVRDELNMGTELVLTQLPKIIQFLVANIPTDLSKAKNLPLIYLDILNKLSEFVEDSEVGEHFASTLLSYIENDRLKNEEKITAVLQTIARLVGFVKDPQAYLRRLPRLLSTINFRASREALVSIISALSNHGSLSNEKSFVSNLKLLEDLEAWDKKKLNEPDQERRHKSLADLDRLYTSAKVKLDPLNIVLFVRSHASTISSVDDIALRSAASGAFSSLISYTSKTYSDNNQVKQDLLRKHFLPLIANGIRSKNEAIRNEFIIAFDMLISCFAECDTQLFSPFKQLQNDDKEIDFFANVTHIQHHRRQRAFKRLVTAMEENTITFSFDSLMKFILPMVHPYFLLTEPKYAQLVAESLNVLREIMKHASWTKYYRMLTTYIHQLTTVEQTKPYVRVIVAIVDAFHFDLQHCDFKPTEFQMAKNPKKDKRKLGSALRRKNFEDKNAMKEVEKVLEESEEEADEKMKDEKEKAKKILEAVLQNVLPKLQETIKPNHKLLGHKKSHVGKYFTEDEDLKRVPLALATVKLLQKLPEWVLNRHLHNVVVTLINLLLSRSSEVRQSARKTMQQVIQGLGVRHLPFFIKEMKQTLTRGYQVHVMIYTIHFMIQSMEAQLKTGDLDQCLDVIVDVCKQEQFSDTTDEKELSTAVSEAKANKTGETYQYLGKFVSYESLMKVVNPMKEIFEAKPSATTMKKLSGLLRSFVHGLRINDGIAPTQLLTFTQKILDSNLSDMTKQLAASQPAIQAEEDRKKNGFRPESCYILPTAPKRLGAIVKTSVKAQSSIFVEFGVNLLANLLKVHAFDPKKPEDAEKLDPFLPIIIGCLKTKYEKIIGVSLRCLHGLLKFPLPSVEANKSEIIERLFVVLADYAGLGSAGHLGSIQELSQNLFKCFNQMIHIAQASILTPKRLQILLNYCETDILDSQKQATAFALIKSILGKRIKDDKIISMMDYLAELSITSTIQIVRANCREIIIQYITNYRIVEEDAEKWLTFYLEQLEYEFEDGRLSALEMVNSIINAFTEEVNNKFALLVFIKLAARFVNDESKKCIKFVQLALQKLLQTTTAKAHHELLTVAKDWLSSDNESTQVIGCKVTAELCRGLPTTFASRMEQFLPLLGQQFGELSTSEFSENVVLALFEAMTYLCQIVPTAFLENFILVEKENAIIEKLNEFLQCVLSKPVQFSASGFLGQLLSTLKNEETTRFHKKLQKLFESSVGWSKLCYSVCFQLKGKSLTEATVDQLVKNLVFLSSQISDDDEYGSFCQRIANVCSAEVALYPTESLRRKGIFKLTAACALQASEERGTILTKRVLPSLHREMLGKSSADKEDLQSLASEVGEILKKQIGQKEYALILIECSKKANEKSAKRKEEQATLAVTDPQAAAQAKRRKHEKKTENRKRKLDQLKPYRIAKRKARNDIQQRMEDADAMFFDDEEED